MTDDEARELKRQVDFAFQAAQAAAIDKHKIVPTESPETAELQKHEDDDV
jgi:hypothetical protein